MPFVLKMKGCFVAITNIHFLLFVGSLLCHGWQIKFVLVLMTLGKNFPVF